jgi:5-methylthioadenosine/S-adenosylhomocysteine deaminase
MREPADLLIEPRWLLPVVPQTVLEGHALVVGGGRILALGPAEQLRARFAAASEVRRAQHALIPGFINAHTRASLTLLRSLRPYGRPQAPPGAPAADFVRDGTRLAIAQMLKAGTTCFADLSEYPEEAARVAAAAQVRAAIALPISETADGLGAQLARTERLWDEYRADARLSLFFAPVGAALTSEPLLQRLRRVVDELDARLTLLLEGAGVAGSEVRDAGAHERSALERLCALGLLRPGVAAIAHGPLSPSDLALLARHGACLISCPQQDLRSAPAPVPLLEGERSALGSGNPLAAGALDLRREARTAALLSGFDAATALRLATLGGATALGLQAHLGSLEPGKAADFVCLEPDALSLGSAAAGLEESLIFGAAPVTDVWSGGRALVSERRLLAFDEAELAALSERWARRLRIGAAA